MVVVSPARLDFARTSNLTWSVCKLKVANHYKSQDVTVSRSWYLITSTNEVTCFVLVCWFVRQKEYFLWPPCVADADIIFLPCGFFLSFLFLALSQRPQIGCLPYFHTWCGPGANLECRSEMCCMRLAGNTGRKNDAKKSPSVHHRTTLSGYIFATEARIDNRKKLVKQQYLPHMSLQYGELRPTSG